MDFIVFVGSRLVPKVWKQKRIWTTLCNYWTKSEMQLHIHWHDKEIEERPKTALQSELMGGGNILRTKEFFSSATVFMDEVLSLEHSAKPVDLIMFGHLTKTRKPRLFVADISRWKSHIVKENISTWYPEISWYIIHHWHSKIIIPHLSGEGC